VAKLKGRGAAARQGLQKLFEEDSVNFQVGRQLKEEGPQAMGLRHRRDGGKKSGKEVFGLL